MTGPLAGGQAVTANAATEATVATEAMGAMGAMEDVPAIRLLAEHRPDVLELAEAVSPAVYVEPALLRMARYRLLPHLGAEAEAGLWLGPLATQTRRGLVLTVPALSSLRTRLAADPQRFRAAADIVREVHANAAPSVRLEEEIIRLSLTGCPDSVLEQRLEAVAAAMVQQPRRATDIARWLMVALPRLPERVRRSPAAWALSLRSGQELGSPAPLREPPALDLGRWRALTTVRRPGSMRVVVRLLSDGVQIGEADREDDRAIDIAPTSPRVIEVGAANTAMTMVSFREGERRNVPVSTLHMSGGSTGDLLLSWPDRVSSVAVGDTGESVAVGFASGRVELRDVLTGALRASQEFGAPVTALAIAGGRILAGTGHGVGVWDPDANPRTVMLQAGPVTALAASRTTPAYVVAAGANLVSVSELPGGEGGEGPVTRRFDGDVTAIAVSGQAIVVAAGDSIFLTDPTLSEVGSVRTVVPTRRIAALPDDLFAVLGADGQVRLWQAPRWTFAGTVARDAGPIVDIAVCDGGLVTAGTDRVLRRRTVSELMRQTIPRPPELDQRSAGLIITRSSGEPLRYRGQLHALAGAAASDLRVSGSRGGPLTVRSLAGDAWRLEPTAADDGPLGALPDDQGTRFTIFSGVADGIELCLFDDDGRSGSGAAERRYPMVPVGEGMWQCYLPGVQPGQRYGYRVHGPYDPDRGHRCDPAKLLLDPCGKAVDGQVEWAEALYGSGSAKRPALSDSAPYMPRNVVVSPAFDWEDDRPPRTPYQDTVIYEAHVKGLTMRHREVPPELRGTYAGLAHPAVIRHLSRLGVTAVQLLPVHQFVPARHLIERGMTDYWGYNTISFFAPHNGYASAAIPGGQVGEFKEMVKALHQAGIEVILDVAYTHTAEGGESGPTLSLRGIDNAAYYSLVGDRHAYMDFTGTGNSLNMTSPRVLQLIMDSLRYWAADMHVDGFRFDLASALAGELYEVDALSEFFGLLRQDPVISACKLIGEPWDIGPGGYQVRKFPPSWVEWNGRYRDDVRDFWRAGRTYISDLGVRLSGSGDLYDNSGRRPVAPVNIITSHDGFTLTDLVSYDTKHNEANGEANRDGSDDNRSWNCGVEGPTDDPLVNELRERQKRNLLATLLLSQGVPMLLAGDELGHTQGGNNNAYCQDNEISWLDWSGLGSGGLDDLIARLTRIRRDFPILTRGIPAFTQTPPGEGTGWLQPDGTPFTSTDFASAILAGAVYLAGDPRQAVSEPGPALLLLLNAFWQITTFRLPGTGSAGAWTVLIDTASAQSSPEPYPTTEYFIVQPRSLVLLTLEPDGSAMPESAHVAGA